MDLAALKPNCVYQSLRIKTGSRHHWLTQALWCRSSAMWSPSVNMKARWVYMSRLARNIGSFRPDLRNATIIWSGEGMGRGDVVECPYPVQG